MSNLIEELARVSYNENKMVVDGIFNGQLQRNVLLSFEDFEKQMPKAAKENRASVLAVLTKLAEMPLDEGALDVALAAYIGENTGYVFESQPVEDAIRAYLQQIAKGRV